MKHALIIDDDDTFQGLMKTVLEREGYTVSTANSGAEARARAETEAFEVITIDLALGDDDSAALIPDLRKLHPRSAIYVLTGMGEDDREEARALSEGATGYLSKTGSSLLSGAA